MFSWAQKPIYSIFVHLNHGFTRETDELFTEYANELFIVAVEYDIASKSSFLNFIDKRRYYEPKQRYAYVYVEI